MADSTTNGVALDGGGRQGRRDCPPVGGDGGIESLSGGDGNDELYGADGNDSSQGGSGDDELFGGDGIDYMEGGVGNDTLRGESGADNICENEGADTFRAVDAIADGRLYGGPDDDTAYYDDPQDAVASNSLKAFFLS